jgi:two-component system nitrate/nitrite response regulator NarL
MTAQKLESPAKGLLWADSKASGLGPEVTTALICESLLLLSTLDDILSGTPFVVPQDRASIDLGPMSDRQQEPALLIFAANQFSPRLPKIIQQTKKHYPAARIVAVADHFDLSIVQQGRRAGIDGFCFNSSSPEVLIKSLELVMLGEPVLPLVLVRGMLDSMSLSPQHEPASKVANEQKVSREGERGLSAREAQILNCLADGDPNKVIARKLDVAESTIKIHVKAILRKIGVLNRTQAALWAIGHLPTQAEASLGPSLWREDCWQ